MRERGRNPSPLAVKVYVVFQRINLTHGDEPNCRVLATRLTRQAAVEIQDRTPGTWVEKYVATK